MGTASALQATIATACGLVRAVGIVTGSDTASHQTAGELARSRYHSEAQRARAAVLEGPTIFKFAKSVVERYMLATIFTEHFPEMTQVTNDGEAHKVESNKSLISGDMEPGGYVYLIKSPYGYKIGKTKNMKQRSQLFSVSLPFQIEILRYGCEFADYWATELRYHRTYAHKRLEGDSFNLNESDVSAISLEMKG